MRDNCHLYNVIEEQLFIDIMPLAAFNDILKGVVPIAGSEIIFGKQYYYSAYDYKKHLVNLLELLERNVNYYVMNMIFVRILFISKRVHMLFY